MVAEVMWVQTHSDGGEHMPRLFMSGNQAVALGARDAGVHLVTGYPGTPSTEILESAAGYEGIVAEWSINEKVALEVGLGAALAGARALVTMKHVGLNVAADPLFSASYTDIPGALVLAVADDPGMWSSQNEQDTRHYARAAKVPLLEPADSQEARDMTVEAFQLSRRFRTPVILRLATRISHTRCPVTPGATTPAGKPGGFEPNIQGHVLVPAFARARHELVERRLCELQELACASPLNRAEYRDLELGLVVSGASYHHVREAVPEASTLKLGWPYPVPLALVREFASRVTRCTVIEELDPFLWTELSAAGIDVGPGHGNLQGELTPAGVRQLLGAQPVAPAPAQLPPRPPVLCPGCPHRGVFHALRRLQAHVTGDIGCYTLGTLPPLSALHTCTCMGAGIGEAVGIAAVGPVAAPLVAVIGDSTFMHSGMTGLCNLAYLGSAATVVIMDNRTTAMTGHQPHPGSGQRLSGESGPEISFEAIGRALGVGRVQTVDPWQLDEIHAVLAQEVAAAEPSLVIAQRPCVLLDRRYRLPSLLVDHQLCVVCGACLELGCPAIGQAAEAVDIDATLCAGCGMCAAVCPVEAIGRVVTNEGTTG